MAVIAPTVLSLGNGFVRYRWGPMAGGDSGAWVAARLRDMTISVEGTATSFAFQGSNSQDGSNPRTLQDVDGVTAMSAAGLFVLKEGALVMRPLLTSGNVTVDLVGRP
jgi:hypothetical protein